MKASGGAKSASASAAAAGAQTTGRDQARRVVSARYPRPISRRASFGPSNRTASTPSSAGATAAPSVFTPSARPNPVRDAAARSPRWLNSAPMNTVGGPNATAASTASAAIAARKPPPSAWAATAFSCSAAHSDAVPTTQAAASAPSNVVEHASRSRRATSQRR